MPRPYPRRPAPTRRPALEALEGRVVPTIILPTPGTPGPVLLAGTQQPQFFTVRLEPGSPTKLQVSDDGGNSFQTAALADVTEVDVNPYVLGGNTLTIDNSNGLVGTASGLNVKFNTTPSSAADTLILTGDPGAGTQQTYGPTSGGYALTTTFPPSAVTASTPVAAVSQTVSFPALGNPVADLVPGDLTVAATPGGYAVLGDAPKVGGPTGPDGVRVRLVDRADLALAVDTPSGGNFSDGGGGMPAIDFGNVTRDSTLTVRGAGTVYLDDPTTPARVTRLTVDRGAASSTTLLAAAAPAGLTVTTTNVSRTLTDPGVLFVERLYALRLGRTGTDAEVAYWEGVMSGPGGRAAVVAGIDGSREAATFTVDGWYQHYLGRATVGGEEQYWVNQVLAGIPEEQVLATFLAAPEFGQSAANPGALVNQFYASVLDRAPTPAESGFWGGVLASQGKRGLALGLLTSWEFRINAVYRFYDELLHRTASAAEVSYWAKSTLPLASVRVAFESSAEFLNG